MKNQYSTMEAGLKKKDEITNTLTQDKIDLEEVIKKHNSTMEAALKKKDEIINILTQDKIDLEEVIKKHNSTMAAALKKKDESINILTQNEIDLQEEADSQISEINEWKYSVNEKVNIIQNTKRDFLELKSRMESAEKLWEDQMKKKEDELCEKDNNSKRNILELKSRLESAKKLWEDQMIKKENELLDKDNTINSQTNQLEVKKKSVETMKSNLQMAKMQYEIDHESQIQLQKEMETLKLNTGAEVQKATKDVLVVELKNKEHEATIATLKDELEKNKLEFSSRKYLLKQVAEENSLNKSAVKILGDSAEQSTKSSEFLHESNKQHQQQIDEVSDTLKQLAKSFKSDGKIIEGQLENSELATNVANFHSSNKMNSERAITLEEKYANGVILNKSQLDRMNKARKRQGLEKVKWSNTEGNKRKADGELAQTNKKTRTLG